ncbi:MAG: hypothetical protein IKB56_01695 [Clostridia bacterium]|nr:hypothetical protein [Clostridia bacterium]
MAKKKTLKFNNTTLFILIAIAVILGLIVALAFSPVGQGLMDGMLQDNQDNGNQNNGNGDLKQVVQLGGNLSNVNQEVLLENVNCKIHFINVGQGDAILCQFSDGVNVLIDGGSTSSGLAEIRTNFVEYLFSVGVVDTIDYMIITHPDTDHYNMLTAVMDSFEVEKIFYNDTRKNTTYSTFIDRIAEEVSTENNIGFDGDGEVYDNVISGVGYSFDIIAPGYERFQDENEEFDAYESNGMSPFVLLEVSNRKVLFTGDATYETEEWLLEYVAETNYDIDVDVLKVGHHGSDSSSTAEFLAKVNAEYGVISSDDGTKHDHPTPQVMNRLFDEGVVTYRTNRHGNIVLNVDVDGDFAFQVDNEVPVDNNKNGINDKMIITQD